MTQEAAGEAFGTSGQNWQKYEAGKAPSVFQPAIQRRLTRAVAASVEDLVLVRDQLLQAEDAQGVGPGLAESAAAGFDASDRGRAELRPLLARIWGPSSCMLQMPDDSLRPWAASGCTIVYDTELWPRRRSRPRSVPPNAC